MALQQQHGLPIGLGIRATQITSNECRQVWRLSEHVSGTAAVAKYWPPQRLADGDGANSVQAAGEVRLACSRLATSFYFVPTLDMHISGDKGMVVWYPDAGRSMDLVCGELRREGRHQALIETIINTGAHVLLGLHQLQQLPEPLLHRDIKPENIMQDADGSIRIGDMGLISEEGELDSSHDARYVPLDYLELQPNGEHAYDSDAPLAAANTWRLDVRGLGYTMFETFVGHLPPAMALEHMGQLPLPAPHSLWRLLKPAKQQELLVKQHAARKAARLRRIATLDWAAEVDRWMAGAPEPLKDVTKLMLGTRAQVPSITSLMRHPAFRDAVGQAKRRAQANKPGWLERTAAARKVMVRCEALLACQEVRRLNEAEAEAEGGEEEGGQVAPLALGQALALLHQEEEGEGAGSEGSEGSEDEEEEEEEDEGSQGTAATYELESEGSEEGWEDEEDGAQDSVQGEEGDEDDMQDEQAAPNSAASTPSSSSDGTGASGGDAGSGAASGGGGSSGSDGSIVGVGTGGASGGGSGSKDAAAVVSQSGSVLVRQLQGLTQRLLKSQAAAPELDELRQQLQDKGRQASSTGAWWPLSRSARWGVTAAAVTVVAGAVLCCRRR